MTAIRMGNTNQTEFNFNTFHKSVSISGDNLKKKKERAVKQDGKVLEVFNEYPDLEMAWFEVWPLAQAKIEIGEVSLKRALTNLKTRGELIKVTTVKVESPSGGTCNKYKLNKNKSNN